MLAQQLLLDNRETDLQDLMVSVVGINEIRDYAITKHADQLYGDKPYIFHLDDVSVTAFKAMQLAGVDLETMLVVLKATYTHDVLEDTQTSEGELESVIGSSVLAVKFASKDPSHSRKAALIALIAKTHALNLNDSLEDLAGLIVKMSDGLANRIRSGIGSEMSSPRLYKTYKSELTKLLPAYESLQDRAFIDSKLKFAYFSLLSALALHK
ncbi:hypothetical protein OTK49_01775 [Vibrio coralliirubri]|uniref:hypothetical protein n=1 Tax=Vibrio coralliirubri TaxID=1516159 RepID=UPI0022837450|nr:hypothetical protein [Vibrio coralliirubri]MCY9861242.1 hypothetical protein [Vibrio coralliirubri]